MKTLRRTAAVALVAGLVALVVPGLLRPAEAAPAQDPPAIPLEGLLPVLDQLQPVLEVISPIVYPACANAVLVSVLPGATGVELPQEVSIVLGPLLVLCGSVPIPETNERVCALDAQAQALLGELVKPVLAGGLPVEVAPLKWLTGLLDNIVDLLGVPALPIGSTISGVLQCTDPQATTTTTAPTSAGAEVPPPAVVELPPVSFVDPPSFEDLQTLPPVDPDLVAAPAAPPVVESPEVVLIDQPRFRYPVVMGLPLAFLALLVFFGRALTRPLTHRPGGGS